jgi:transposase InsO family protein
VIAAHITPALLISSCSAQQGIQCSMSRIANCLDNAVAESFFSTLKNEQTLHERYRTRAQARAAILNSWNRFTIPCASTRT